MYSVLAAFSPNVILPTTHLYLYLPACCINIIYILYIYCSSDPRTTKWLLVPSILSPVMVVVTYVLLVWLLPKVMRHREPFQLTSLLVIYNAAMTLLNLYICVEVSSVYLEFKNAIYIYNVHCVLYPK